MAQPANQEVFISAEFLREAPAEEIKEMIAETEAKLLGLRTTAQFNRPERPHLFKAYRRLIARAKTILRERG